ncbi:hypothetical protein A9G24_00845 [Gilliamella sp. App6-5]|jgi:hypothetical protein|uniref:hypothetical protein n=1 Tax=Gilliamella sp. App6-5 TaxID=3120232 RepID=UPI00080DDF2C|nr:hypothetical protein [Gilliamella apicola]OCG15925.1 hypothetical protein A9G24_00845 [Gilliamella apicola]
MKKIPLLLTILLFSWFNTNYTFANTQTASSQYKHREHFATFDDFYQSLPVLSMPFDTHTLAKGKFVDSKFFHFDDDDYQYYDNPLDKERRYFTLKDLTAIGRFEIDNIRFVLYSLTFDSEGEGILEDLNVLNAFDENGKYLDELILSAKTGHEDHIFLYSSLALNNLFHVHINADYSLAYFIDIKDNHYDYKTNVNLTYQFKNNQFWREEHKPNCQSLDLKGYLNSLDKKQFADVADVAAFNDYIACYPVSEHLNTYKKIASYIRDTRYHFLSDAEYHQLKNQLKIILED